jgi:plastocyanin
MTTITTSEVAKPTVAGDRFLAAGLHALAAIFVGLMLLAGEVTPFWGMPAAVYLALGLALQWRAPRWLLVTAVVVPLLQVVTSLPFMIPGFTHPETPANFLPDVFIVIGSLAVIAGAMVALRRTQRSRRPIAVVAGVVAGAAILASVVAMAGVSSATRQAGDVEVTALNFDYPERVELERGQALYVQNQDRFRHTFVVEGTDVRAELPGSAAVRIETDLAPGTYKFFCDVPGHEDAMQGALYVE